MQYTPMHENNCLSCHRCLINKGVEKNEQHLSNDLDFDHQIYLSKSKCGAASLVRNAFGPKCFWSKMLLVRNAFTPNNPYRRR
jgi:hypothetical protein